MVGILRQALLVAAAGTGIGFALNAASPHPVPLGRPVYAAAEAVPGACQASQAVSPLPRIQAGEAAALCSACAAGFVDARSAREYAAGHVAGAVHLPPAGHPDEASALARLSAFHTVVVYDGDPSCSLAEGVARRLREKGFEDVRVLSGAWPAWLVAGGPGASGACSVCDRGHAAEASR